MFILRWVANWVNNQEHNDSLLTLLPFLFWRFLCQNSQLIKSWISLYFKNWSTENKRWLIILNNKIKQKLLPTTYWHSFMNPIPKLTALVLFLLLFYSFCLVYYLFYFYYIDKVPNTTKEWFFSREINVLCIGYKCYNKLYRPILIQSVVALLQKSLKVWSLIYYPLNLRLRVCSSWENMASALGNRWPPICLSSSVTTYTVPITLILSLSQTDLLITNSTGSAMLN